MMKFSHVAVNVTSLERSARFYQQVAGYEVATFADVSGPVAEAMMGIPEGAGARAAFLAGGGSRPQIELTQWHGVPGDGPACAPGRRGILLLSFATSTAELAGLPARITAAGGSCRALPEATTVGELTITVLVAADPDGNLIEFTAVDKRGAPQPEGS